MAIDTTPMTERRPRRLLQRILVAVDLRPASLRAADEAITLAVRQGADLIVLSVVDRGAVRIPGGRSWQVHQERDRLSSGAAAIVARARAAGVRATYLVWDGDPADAIIDAAIAEGVDAIVVGSRGFGPVRRKLLGSVSSEVARLAPCKVVVAGAS